MPIKQPSHEGHIVNIPRIIKCQNHQLIQFNINNINYWDAQDMDK